MTGRAWLQCGFLLTDTRVRLVRRATAAAVRQLHTWSLRRGRRGHSSLQKALLVLPVALACDPGLEVLLSGTSLPCRQSGSSRAALSCRSQGLTQRCKCSILACRLAGCQESIEPHADASHLPTCEQDKQRGERGDTARGPHRCCARLQCTAVMVPACGKQMAEQQRRDACRQAHRWALHCLVTCWALRPWNDMARELESQTSYDR